jgi:hypothetical protein
MIDLALDELAKLIVSLDKNPNKTRKEQNLIKKIQEYAIRYRIFDIIYAKVEVINYILPIWEYKVILSRPLCPLDGHPFGNQVHHQLDLVKTPSLHLPLYYFDPPIVPL